MKIMPVIDMSQTDKTAKSVSNANLPSSLMAAHYTALVKDNSNDLFLELCIFYCNFSFLKQLFCFPEVQCWFGQQTGWNDMFLKRK